MKKLCGISIARNAVKYDYCLKESLLSMLEVCDHVICAYVECEDGTKELIESIKSEKLQVMYLPDSEWDVHNNKFRLSYITNIALAEAERLEYEYVIYVQADEVLSERSADSIKIGIDEGHEAYLVKRVNLWKSPYLQLDVPQERKPCSTEVIRLTKSCYRAYDDAENINAQTLLYIPTIVIYHMGFVRKREIMKDKIINMQQGVFAMEHYDNKLDQCEIFNPDLWFDPKTDLKPIDEPLPKLIKEWAAERHYED